MKVVTGWQMRQLDHYAIQEVGIPETILMENAGIQVVLALERRFGPLTGKRICVVCGKGNNGGDGIVIARHLHNRRVDVSVILLADKKDVKARTNLEIALMMEIEVNEVTTESDFPLLKDKLNQSQIIVDAMFGTGLQNHPRSFYLDVIQAVNAAPGRVVAVDIPTGLNSETGEVMGSCINADFTVTFGLPKLGLIMGPSREHAGQVEVVDIGIPRSILEDDALKVNLLTQADIASHFRKRKPNTHKGSYGHLLLIAGSPGKTGAAVLAAKAALRVGAGLVTLAVPHSVHHIIEAKTTEAMSLPMPETPAHTISPLAERELIELSRIMDVVAIGPGLGRAPETKKLVNELLSSLELPTVIDADAIRALSLSSLPFTRARLLFTPHPGEMAGLLGVSIKDIQGDRLEAACRTAEVAKTYVVLKGDRTVIADPRGNAYINPTGNPGMATAGTGDVLCGMIAGFIAQGMRRLHAATSAVYIHGLAGDITAELKGQHGMLSSDLLENIPLAMKQVLGEPRKSLNLCLTQPY